MKKSVKNTITVREQSMLDRILEWERAHKDLKSKKSKKNVKENNN